MELDNLRVALEWHASDSADLDRGLRVAGQLWWFWTTRSRHTEGLKHLQRLLARDGEVASPASRAEALHGAGMLTWAQGAGDLEAARSLHEEALEMHEGFGDRWGLARSLNALGIVATRQGDATRARRKRGGQSLDQLRNLSLENIAAQPTKQTILVADYSKQMLTNAANLPQI